MTERNWDWTETNAPDQPSALVNGGKTEFPAMITARGPEGGMVRPDCGTGEVLVLGI
jgi:hypothetical protein